MSFRQVLFTGISCTERRQSLSGMLHHLLVLQAVTAPSAVFPGDNSLRVRGLQHLPAGTDAGSRPLQQSASSGAGGTSEYGGGQKSAAMATGMSGGGGGGNGMQGPAANAHDITRWHMTPARNEGLANYEYAVLPLVVSSIGVPHFFTGETTQNRTRVGKCFGNSGEIRNHTCSTRDHTCNFVIRENKGAAERVKINLRESTRTTGGKKKCVECVEGRRAVHLPGPTAITSASMAVSEGPVQNMIRPRHFNCAGPPSLHSASSLFALSVLQQRKLRLKAKVECGSSYLVSSAKTMRGQHGLNMGSTCTALPCRAPCRPRLYRRRPTGWR